MFKFAVVLLCAAAVTALPAKIVPDENRRIDVNGNWRIFGGTNAPVGEFPQMVSLRTAGNNHFCGGTIVNGWNVLTAAHCLIGRTIANTISVFGTNTLNAGGISRGSVALIIHASYNPISLANDIAIIRLANAIGMSSSIQQTVLNTVDTGVVAGIIIGWGTTGPTPTLPNQLQQLSVNTMTHAACQATWGATVSPQQICITSPVGQGACSGDSGGPLLQTINGAQLGIASFVYGGGCGQVHPDVYVRVSSHISWIQSATNW